MYSIFSSIKVCIPQLQNGSLIFRNAISRPVEVNIPTIHSPEAGPHREIWRPGANLIFGAQMIFYRQRVLKLCAILEIDFHILEL
jgi:hypothetical protein